MEIWHQWRHTVLMCCLIYKYLTALSRVWAVSEETGLLLCLTKFCTKGYNTMICFKALTVWENQWTHSESIQILKQDKAGIQSTANAQQHHCYNAFRCIINITIFSLTFHFLIRYSYNWTKRANGQQKRPVFEISISEHILLLRYR